MQSRALSRSEVTSVIPHRDHALFVDDVHVDGWEVRGGSCWSAAHPHLQGHFPGMPIVPGVYLIEAAAQLGGVAICQRGGDAAGLMGVLAGVRRCHFHRFVRPNERVEFSLRVAPMPGTRMYSVSGQGLAAGEKAVSVDIVVAMVAADSVQEAA